MINYVLSPIPLEDFERMFKRLIQGEFSNLNRTDEVVEVDELLTRKQAANLLGVSLPTLHDYTKRGLIPAYRIGSRIRYKKGEILDCLTKVQIRNSLAS